MIEVYFPDYQVPSISPFRDQSIRGHHGSLYSIEGNRLGLTYSVNVFTELPAKRILK